MVAIPGNGTSSLRDQAPSSSRVASLPLILGAVVAWLAITWTVGLRQGLLFVVGIGFGAILAAVSFGFTTGWRVWIRERDPTGFLAQFLAIGLAMLVSIPLIAANAELSGAIAPLSVSLVIGAFGAASIIGAFVFGWPSIIAVIINYVKRNEARGTYLESHFSWQIRTFWWALLIAVIIAVLGLVLAIVIVGFAIWIIGFFVLGIWAIYRIARGWLKLKDRQPMPA